MFVRRLQTLLGFFPPSRPPSPTQPCFLLRASVLGGMLPDVTPPLTKEASIPSIFPRLLSLSHVAVLVYFSWEAHFPGWLEVSTPHIVSCDPLPLPTGSYCVGESKFESNRISSGWPVGQPCCWTGVNCSLYPFERLVCCYAICVSIGILSIVLVPSSCLIVWEGGHDIYSSAMLLILWGGLADPKVDSDRLLSPAKPQGNKFLILVSGIV